MKSTESFVWKEVNIDDFEWLDIDSKTLSYNCSCGDVFWTTLSHLQQVISVENNEKTYCVILQCESCSLRIKLIFDLESLDRKVNSIK
ncbi:putative diphthamide biosynthesis protein 3 [Cryptosporidium felis]|nr:putative diphthamide biosynthesis protein 3 [Cryptosporidium felis]